MKRVFRHTLFLQALVILGTCFVGASIVSAATVGKPTNYLGLIGYWTFDGKDMIPNVRDISGQGNHGTLVGQTSTTSVMGKIGQALGFDGSNDYVSLPDSASLRPTSVTISAWVYYTGPIPTDNSKPIVALHANDVLLRVKDSNDAHLETLIYSGTVNLIDGGAGSALTRNVWTHVATTFDGTNVLIYKDGVQTGSATAPAIVWEGGVVAPSIGSLAGGSGGKFPGSIDDVRIYGRALSAAEISRQYNSNAAKFGISKPQTVSGGLIGHWTFDGKDMIPNVRDISGQGNHGKLSGQTSTTTALGKIGQALRFDGVNDRVDVTTDLMASGDRTVCTWARLNGSLANGEGQSFVDTVYFQFQYYYATPDYYLFTTSNANNGVTVAIPDPTGIWNHVCVTRPSSGANSQYYLNGVAHGASSNTGTPNSAFNLGIGGNAASNANFDGNLDDVRIYNRLLSANEIRSIYNLGNTKAGVSSFSLSSGLVGYWTFDGKDMIPNVRDVSGQGNHGYLEGQTATTSVIGKIGQAMSFDGVNDAIRVPDNSSYETDNITLAAWFNASSFPGNWPQIMGKQSGGGFQFEIDHAGNDCAVGVDRVCANLSISGLPYFVGSLTTIVPGTWYHAVFTVDGTNMKLYVNGVLEGTTPHTIPMQWSGANLRIGSDTNGSDGIEHPFHGKIDEVRYYNRALTASEVSQLYTSGR